MLTRRVVHCVLHRVGITLRYHWFIAIPGWVSGLRLKDVGSAISQEDGGFARRCLVGQDQIVTFHFAGDTRGTFLPPFLSFFPAEKGDTA